MKAFQHVHPCLLVTAHDSTDEALSRQTAKLKKMKMPFSSHRHNDDCEWPVALTVTDRTVDQSDRDDQDVHDSEHRQEPAATSSTTSACWADMIRQWKEAQHWMKSLSQASQPTIAGQILSTSDFFNVSASISSILTTTIAMSIGKLQSVDAVTRI
ncbi:hypothetical protein MRB53_039932 [Persea americana]|nr:hypothetical protein MRB53_039932 [Persea americana]